VLPNDPINPLKDVWLRPRRVFRELATQPVGVVDYLLGAAQGVVNCLALYRTQGAGLHDSVEEILGKSFLFGPFAGIASLFVMGFIYGRLGRRAGGASKRPQVFHVLAYGGVPVLVSLGLWVLTALLAGESTFVETPRADIEIFVVLLLHAQFIAYILLQVWSVVLQVMGFSELLAITIAKALGLLVMGQILLWVGLAMLLLLLVILFPNLMSVPST
jgi:hypothetical protein